MSKQFTLLLINSIVLLAVFAPAPLGAEGISLMANLEYNLTDTETTNKNTGLVTNTDFTLFRQLYNLRLDKEVYPYLFIGAGGFFELIDRDTKTDGIKTDSKERSFRPFAEINLTNPLYRAGLAYRTGELKESGNTIPTAKTYFKEYTGLFSWRPQDFPSLDINYSRTLFDDEPLTVDFENELFNLRSKYEYKDLLVDYNYNQTDQLDKIADSGTLTTTHNGGVQYSHDYYNNRLSLDAGARVIVTTTEFSGTGDAKIPTLTPGSNFYIPNDVDPFSNVASDINRTTLTAVNIGQAGWPNPVSAGLEFDSATEVDTAYIVLFEDANDPRLATPAEIASVADSFSWRLFTSNDQLNWTEQPLPPANVTYNEFENRFEFNFTALIDTQYFKIYTTPLPPTSSVTGDIRYLDIQSFTTVTGDTKEDLETVNQTYNFGAQWAISDKSSTGYDLRIRDIEAKPEDSTRTSITNSLFFRHLFNPMFNLNARLIRTDITETDRVDVVNYSFTASLRGDYLDTFNQTLIYSGTNTDDAQGSGYTNSLILRNNADLYEGWSMFLDGGYAWNKRAQEGKQTSWLMRVGTRLLPNRSLDVNLDYSASLNTEEGLSDYVLQIGTLRTLWVITDTMNLFLNYDFRERSGDNPDSTYLLDYSINWSPFPDGSLEFSLTYNETIGNRGEDTEFLTPRVIWQIAPGMFLDLRYNLGTVESEAEKSDVNSLIGTLRLFL
jgi:hypothetical protein